MTQYRVYGSFEWMSSSGNAIVAIFNPPGSGKKLTINSFEAQNLTSLNPTAFGAAASPSTVISLAKFNSISTGTLLSPTAFDTNDTMPSAIKVSTGAACSGQTLVRRISVTKQLAPGNLSWIARQSHLGPAGKYVNRARKFLECQPMTINAGENLSLFSSSLTSSIPFRVCMTLQVDGNCYSFTKFVTPQSQGTAMITIENAAGSGISAKLIELSIEEVGTYDSPYLQLVPIGQIDALAMSDPTKLISPTPMDTNYSEAPFKVITDCPILPYGVPAQYISDASTGSPKGFNYLMTKDFLGPVYRTCFPENEGTNNHAAPSATSTMDGFGVSSSHKSTDLMVHRSNITINEGEGVALVSGAETAVTSNPVGMSGWSSWNFGAQITVESKYSPTLTLSGLMNGTEVRIYDADGNELSGTESSGTSFQYSYSYDEDSLATIVIHSLGYIPIRLDGFILGSESQTVPIQQQVDRQYSNTA